jgi:hypothetical protein
MLQDRQNLTGEELTVTQGDEEAYINFTAELTGQPMTMTLQYSEVVINATGFGLTMQEGDETCRLLILLQKFLLHLL